MDADNRLRMTENVEVDFGGLFGGEDEETTAQTSPAEPLSGDGEYKNLDEGQKPNKPAKNAPQSIAADAPQELPAKTLIRQAEREQENRKREQEIYRDYQANIRRSEQLQTEIFKGLKAGEDIYSLFLKAAEAIGAMTGNSGFLPQIAEDLKTIYGAGLRQSQPLTLELEEARARLQRLLEADLRENSPEQKRRISAAINEHRHRITALEAAIKEAEKQEKPQP